MITAKKFMIEDPVFLGSSPEIKGMVGELDGEFFYPNNSPRVSYHTSITYNTRTTAKKALLKRYKYHCKENIYSLIIVTLSLLVCFKNYLLVWIKK